jgi:hypothetical protein
MLQGKGGRIFVTMFYASLHGQRLERKCRRAPESNPAQRKQTESTTDIKLSTDTHTDTPTPCYPSGTCRSAEWVSGGAVGPLPPSPPAPTATGGANSAQVNSLQASTAPLTYNSQAAADRNEEVVGEVRRNDRSGGEPERVPARSSGIRAGESTLLGRRSVRIVAGMAMTAGMYVPAGSASANTRCGSSSNYVPPVMQRYWQENSQAEVSLLVPSAVGSSSGTVAPLQWN